MKSKVAKINPALSIVTVNVNDLNNSFKRQFFRLCVCFTQLYAITKRHVLDSKTQID